MRLLMLDRGMFWLTRLRLTESYSASSAQHQPCSFGKFDRLYEWMSAHHGFRKYRGVFLTDSGGTMMAEANRFGATSQSGTVITVHRDLHLISALRIRNSSDWEPMPRPIADVANGQHNWNLNEDTHNGRQRRS